MPDKPETPSAVTVLVPEMPEYRRIVGSSPVIQYMAKAGVPLTRENYIGSADDSFKTAR